MRDVVRRSAGAVLPLVLLLVLALELLAHGALLMARQEAAASRASSRLLQGREAVDAGLTVTETSVVDSVSAVAPWGATPVAEGSVGTGRYRVLLRRLDRERWLEEGEGWVEGARWRVRRGALAWLPDPVARLGAFPGVVVVGATAPVTVLGAVETTGVRRDDPGLDTTPCRPWLAQLDSLFGGGGFAGVAQVDVDAEREPSLGALGRDELLGWIGTGSPSARMADGDLRLEGVEGAGLLVVGGNLELVGGRHEGVVIVGGRLSLREGAVLVGFARAAGGLEVGPASRVVGSGCRALVALTDGLAGWIRPFPLSPGRFPLY